MPQENEKFEELKALIRELLRTRSGKKSQEISVRIVELSRQLRPVPQTRREELAQAIHDRCEDLLYMTDVRQSRRLANSIQKLCEELSSLS